MTRHILPLILLASACLAQTVPLRWSVELGDARPARFTLVRGDTVELAADLFVEGRPYNPATADASLLWQTNGMDELWWEVPAAVVSNRGSATWTPAMDSGAASYLCHFRVGSSTGSVFRAYARLAMQHGPGDPPNALPLPVPFIDFAKVAVTNEPWSASSGLTTNDVEAIVAADASIARYDSSGGLNAYEILAATNSARAAAWFQPERIMVWGEGEYGDGEGSTAIYFPANTWGTMAVREDLADYAKTDSLGTAAYRDASEFATAADEARVYQLLTNRLSGVTFDFATVAGLYLAISNIVAAQGGAITNFPAIP